MATDPCSLHPVLGGGIFLTLLKVGQRPTKVTVSMCEPEAAWPSGSVVIWLRWTAREALPQPPAQPGLCGLPFRVLVGDAPSQGCGPTLLRNCPPTSCPLGHLKWGCSQEATGGASSQSPFPVLGNPFGPSPSHEATLPSSHMPLPLLLVTASLGHLSFGFCAIGLFCVSQP